MNESAEWTERLTSLRFDLPRHRVRQVENTQIYREGWDDGPIPIFGTCLMPGESSPEVEFVDDAGSVQFAPAVQSAKAPYFDATSQRSHHPTEWQSNFGYPQPPPWDEAAYSEIRPWPQFYFTDLNADGLSDLVMSVYLSGYHMSLGNCDSPTEDDPSAANWVEGERTRIVFINNGEGWDLDDGRDPGRSRGGQHE